MEVAMFARALKTLIPICVACLGLVGCEPGPEIVEFSADRSSYLIGEKATLTVRFSGGIGRIDPDIGPVQDGAIVQTGVLDGPKELRLVVQSAGVSVTRSLRLPVQYRDSYRTLGATFSSLGHTASLAADGSVLLIGGSRGQGTLSTSIERFDPRSNTLRKIGNLPNGRKGHRAVRLSSGRILVTGGSTGLPVTTAEVVDERTGAVSPTGNPRVQRVSHTATRFGNDKVLITGGYSSGEGAMLGISRSAEIWDPATGQFRLLGATLVAPRAGHTATLMPDGRVLVVGGFSTGRGYEFAEVFDPTTETFAVVASVENRERGLHATAKLPDGSVLVLGGETEATVPRATVVQFLADGGGTSRVLADLVRPRTLVEGAVSRDGRVFLFGGEVGPGNVTTATAEAYSAATGGATIADMPQARVGHTTTRLLDGRFLIAGGEDGDGRLAPAVLLYE
jgi:hypothetical protein